MGILAAHVENYDFINDFAKEAAKQKQEIVPIADQVEGPLLAEVKKDIKKDSVYEILTVLLRTSKDLALSSNSADLVNKNIDIDKDTAITMLAKGLIMLYLATFSKLDNKPSMLEPIHAKNAKDKAIIITVKPFFTYSLTTL